MESILKDFTFLIKCTKLKILDYIYLIYIISQIVPNNTITFEKQVDNQIFFNSPFKIKIIYFIKKKIEWQLINLDI